MRVGFIGLGNIGRPIAEHIALAGFPLVVHDIRKEAAGPLIDQGAEWAGSPKEAAAQADVVCTCLPGPAEMEEVVLGKGGIIEGVRPGAIYVDHTTNSPELVRKVHDKLAKNGVQMLDAPVTGGMEGAQKKELTVLVGGDGRTLEQCKPVLEAIGKRVLHAGEIGTGTVCKLMFNCAGFSAVRALVECITLWIKAGVELAVLLDMFQNSDALSGYMNVRLPATLFQGKFEPARFALGLAHKDMRLATELGRSYDVPMSLADLTEADMSEAMFRGWASKDSSAFLMLQEERAGVDIRAGEESSGALPEA